MSQLHYRALTTKPEAGKPLLFAFHGTGGDERQFFELSKSLVPGAGVVSPRGDVSEMGAMRFFRRTGEGIYDMDDLSARTQTMAAYIDAFKEQYPESPVYGFGYSNGANILASVVMARPDLFDRVGLLHPLIPWQPAPVEGLEGRQVLVSAGRRDPITPWPESERLIGWFKDQGTVVTTEVHDGGHELRQQEVAALAKLFS